MVEADFAYPDTVHLRPKRVKKIAMIVICLMFAVSGVFMVRSGDVNGWISIGCFGPGLILALLSANPRASGMVVMSEGFAVRSLIRTDFYYWKDVGEFGVFTIPAGHVPKKMIGFCGPSKKRVASKVSSIISGGYSHSLADTYGMKAENLVAN